MDNNDVKPMLFKLELTHHENFDLLAVGFNVAVIATNCEIVEYVNKAKNDVFKSGCHLLKINGACSLIVLGNLMVDLIYWYTAIAIFDPKLEGYVIAHSEHPDFKVGQLLK